MWPAGPGRRPRHQILFCSMDNKGNEPQVREGPAALRGSCTALSTPSYLTKTGDCAVVETVPHPAEAGLHTGTHAHTPRFKHPAVQRARSPSLPQKPWEEGMAWTSPPCAAEETKSQRDDMTGPHLLRPSPGVFHKFHVNSRH